MEIFLILILVLVPIVLGWILLEVDRAKKTRPGYYSAHPYYSGEEEA
jgi:hypothetical protein